MGWWVNYNNKEWRGEKGREANGDGKKGNGREKREESKSDNRALVSWRKLKCRWLGILLSSHTSLPILKAPSLISLPSHFSLTSLFHFLSPHSSLLSLPSVPFYSLSCTPFCAPPSLSAPLGPPCSCLSLRSKLHVAVNSLPGGERRALRCGGSPRPEEGRSLSLDLITPPASGYDTLERDSHRRTSVRRKNHNVTWMSCRTHTAVEMIQIMTSATAGVSVHKCSLWMWISAT